MNASPSPAPQIAAPAPRPRRRWLRIVLLVLALLVLAPVVTMLCMMHATRNAWTEAEAEADRLEPRWRLMEIEADLKPIPDQENSALVIMAVVRAGGGVQVTGVPNYDKMFEKLPPNVELNTQQIQVINGELAKIVKPLADARKLKDMPQGRFPITYTDDFISTLIPEQQRAATGLADWLPHDAFVLAHEGKYDEALESCRATINAGRAVKDGAFLISLLIRVAIQNQALYAVERVLAQGEASEEALQTMQAVLDKEIKDSSWLTAIRGERAGTHHLFENIRLGKVKDIHLLRLLTTNRPASNLSEWLLDRFPSTMLHYYPEYLKHMTRCVEVAKVPIHERGPKMQEWVQDGADTKNPVIRLLAPALGKCHQAECRGQALLRSAMAAMACERFRKTHECWPATLDELVQAKLLEAVPLDPIDGQPLRYVRKKDHLVIYSIGIDKIDNQGNIDRERPNNPGVDVGFRLWNRDERRKPPLPPVGLPEGK